MYLLTLIIDKDPEAAAICTSAFPLFGSLSVAKCRSSWTTVYNSKVIKAHDKISSGTNLNKDGVVALNCPCKNRFVIFGIH